MARKRTSPLEDIVLATSKLPWWAGLSLALVSFVVLHALATPPAIRPTGPGQLGAAVTGTLFATLAMFGQYVFPFAFSVAALVSFVNSTRQKKLYDATLGRPGAKALNEVSWGEFETLVAEFFRRKGFQVTREGGDGPDGGVDLVLRQKTETYLVQCKQWKAYKVGVQPVREFYGVMASRGAAGGYFVTSGEYTEEAKDFVRGLNVELVDGRRLRGMMDVARTGPAPAASAPAEPVPAAAPGCPKCGAEMTRRTARQGANAGQPFWGCTTFPKCNGTRPWEEQSAPESPAPVAQQPAAAGTPATRSCPDCGEEMPLRQLKSGPREGQYFYGCTKCRKGWPAEQPA